LEYQQYERDSLIAHLETRKAEILEAINSSDAYFKGQISVIDEILEILKDLQQIDTYEV